VIEILKRTQDVRKQKAGQRRTLAPRERVGVRGKEAPEYPRGCKDFEMRPPAERKEL